MTRNTDDPFAMGDATILRPRLRRRPDASRASGGSGSDRPGSQPLSDDGRALAANPDSAFGVPSGSAAGAFAVSSSGVPGGGAFAASPAGGSAGGAFFAPAAGEVPAFGSNPLLYAAVPLLALAGELRGRMASMDIEALRQHTVQEIRSFEDQLRRIGAPAEDVLAARYALCTAIDEAVLNTPWGARSGWAGQSLLVTFHRESSGGEKFFQILDRVQREASRYVALLELLHACLALGFEGRYRLDERGPAKLAEVRQNLYRTIQSVRGSAETDLSPHWKGVEDRRNAVMRFVPLWVVAAACVGVLLGSFLLFNTWLAERTDRINAVLANVGVEPLFVPAPAREAPQITFRTLLAEQIAQGFLGVDEQPDGRTFITLTAPDLFASASESVNVRYANLINAIGTAAEKIPGRLTVIGHTDDQPLRSLRFADNYELSRARAMQVAGLLRGRLREPDRVDFVGKGSSEPRYRPESVADNRARNRRVEIVHRRS